MNINQLIAKLQTFQEAHGEDQVIFNDTVEESTSKPSGFTICNNEEGLPYVKSDQVETTFPVLVISSHR